MSNDETVAEVLREIRARADNAVIRGDCSEKMAGKLELQYADRIEAAHAREMRAVMAHAYAGGYDSAIGIEVTP